MNKNELASKFTSDNDERLILCKVLDRYNAARNNGYLTYVGFLSDRVQILAERLLKHIGASEEEYVFDGGYEGASRRIIIFLPDYMTEDDVKQKEYSPLRFIRASFYKDYKLTHRDFLGALMGDGVAREAVGDILVNTEESNADIAVTEGILGYMLHSFFQAGRARIDTAEIERSELCVPEQKTAIVKDTVASLRLDGIIASAFGISREKAATAVERGITELNHFPCSKGEKLLSEGDTVSVRGYGKFVLSEIGSTSKKGRIFIEIKRYL